MERVFNATKLVKYVSHKVKYFSLSKRYSKNLETILPRKITSKLRITRNCKVVGIKVTSPEVDDVPAPVTPLGSMVSHRLDSNTIPRKVSVSKSDDLHQTAPSAAPSCESYMFTFQNTTVPQPAPTSDSKPLYLFTIRKLPQPTSAYGSRALFLQNILS